MADENSNDNSRHAAGVRRPADPAGHAAILLVESLIHGLVDRGVISAKDAVEIVLIAAEVKQDTGTDLGDSPDTLGQSLAILHAICTSLGADIV